jgi:hypothetical protein
MSWHKLSVKKTGQTSQLGPSICNRVEWTFCGKNKASHNGKPVMYTTAKVIEAIDMVLLKFLFLGVEVHVQ